MGFKKKVLAWGTIATIICSQILPIKVLGNEIGKGQQMRTIGGSVSERTTSSQIEVTTPAQIQLSNSIVDKDGIATISNGVYTITYNLNTGRGNIRFGDRDVVQGFYSSCKLATENGIILSSYDPGVREVAVEELIDSIYGREGKRLILTNILDSGYEMKVSFDMYDDESFLLSEIEVSSIDNTTLEVELISPISCEQIDIGEYSDERIFTTPYTNNNDFGVAPVNDFGTFPDGTAFDGLSYWVCSIFDNKNYAGFIAGAATTIDWKSFQQLEEADAFNGPVQGVKLYNAGGTQTGSRIKSDKFFLGYYEDYRDGLEEYGEIYAQGEERMHWDGDVPLGYNSWYATRFVHSLDDMKNVVDYVAENLKDYGYEYVNLDATPLTDREKLEFAKYCNEKGLKAGAYECPFIVWESQLGETIPGTVYTYDEAMLRDENGEPISWYLGGAFVLDATHPAGEAAINQSIGKIIDYGYEFFKLDFIDYGMQEGNHYISNMNGMKAFRHGMEIIRNLVEEAEETRGQKIFISESIAPLYPSAFAHARRTGCDTELGISEKAYSGLERQAFNAVASWFTNGTIWQYNDADMVLVDNYVGSSYWMNTYSQNHARILGNYVATGGGVWLLSDNLPLLDRDRMEQIVMNESLLEVARKGEAGRPVKMTNFLHHNEESPALTYFKDDNDDRIVVVTNWDRSRGKSIDIEWQDIELQPDRAYDVIDITNNNYLGSYSDKVTIDFEGALDSRLLRITSKGDLQEDNRINLAKDQHFTASSTYYNMEEYAPGKMGDESWETRWSAGEHKNQWVEVNFEEETWINQLVIKEYKTAEQFGYNYSITDFKIEYWDGEAYQTLTTGGKIGYERVIDFKPIKVSKIRVLMNATFLPSLREIEAYYVPEMTYETIILDEKSKEEYSNYSDIKENMQRMQVFKAETKSLTRIDVNMYKTGNPKNLNVGVYKLDENYQPQEQIFEANILAENFPTELTRIPIYCNLNNLIQGEYYGVVFSSPQSEQSNTYGYGYTVEDRMGDSFEMVSVDSGKNWALENEGKRNLMMTLYAEGEQQLQNDIRDVKQLPGKRVKLNTKFKKLELPQEVEVELLDGSKRMVAIQWNEGSYNSKEVGEYVLEGDLLITNDLTNSKNHVAVITVSVEKNKDIKK